MKIILCLGLWLAFMLFVALSYSLGADCEGMADCANGRALGSVSLAPKTASSENAMPATRDTDLNKCNGQPIVSANQALTTTPHGDSYLIAPALVLTLTDSAPQISLCPGVMAIHR